MQESSSLTRIETLRVRNFRVLQDVELKKITPLTVLVGPNGSGKSTLLDVFAFLSECFQSGLRSAWDKPDPQQTVGAHAPAEATSATTGKSSSRLIVLLTT